MVRRTIIQTEVHRTKTCGPRLTADWNNDEGCAPCRNVKRSESNNHKRCQIKWCPSTIEISNNWFLLQVPSPSLSSLCSLYSPRRPALGLPAPGHGCSKWFAITNCGRTYVTDAASDLDENAWNSASRNASLPAGKVLSSLCTISTCFSYTECGRLSCLVGGFLEQATFMFSVEGLEWSLTVKSVVSGTSLVLYEGG